MKAGRETGQNKTYLTIFHEVLGLMGDALHDTVKSPEIADNSDCLPEQVLECVRRLKT